MNNRDIVRFVNKTGTRLKLVVISQALQQAVFLGLAAGIIMLLISRLFVLPYYEFYSYAAAVILVALWLGLAIRKLPGRHAAVQELDRFTPHNQLLTVWQMGEAGGLGTDLTGKTAEILPYSFKLFQKEPKQWLQVKWLIASFAALLILSLLLVFPSTSQQQAKDIEQEQAVIEKLVEKVEEAEKQSKEERVKDELRELAETVKESETAEAALKEVVKKQKELEQLEKQLANDPESPASGQQEDVGQAADKLASEAGETQTELSNMGKPVSFPLQQTIANSEAKAAADAAETETSGQKSGSQAASGEGSAEGASESDVDRETQDSNSGEGTGQSQGQGQSQSQGQGQGQGQGQNQGQGQGQGSTGSNGGSGQGNREFLTVPERIGGSNDPTVDNGEIGEGEAAEQQEGKVTAERGTVRPYSEVVGNYSESYFSSAEQMELPADLQKIVEQYFTSIQSNQ